MADKFNASNAVTELSLAVVALQRTVMSMQTNLAGFGQRILEVDKLLTQLCQQVAQIDVGCGSKFQEIDHMLKAIQDKLIEELSDAIDTKRPQDNAGDVEDLQDQGESRAGVLCDGGREEAQGRREEDTEA